MSTPPTEISLFPVPSPFRRRWAEAHLLAIHTPRASKNRRLLFGLVRRLMYPGIALQVSGQMGPVRHALSQRVVAGTMYVQAPFPALDQSKAAAAQQKALQAQQLKEQQKKNPPPNSPPAPGAGRKPSP
jgi:hypothetical protein